MRPYDRKGGKKDDALLRDNWSFGDFWIITDGYRVSMAQQEIRHAPLQMIRIPKAAFNKMIDWYMRDQPKRRAKKKRTPPR